MDIKKVEEAFKSPKLQNDINKYLWIQSNLHNVDVSTDLTFQKHFNGFNRVRQRNSEFYKVFYEFMEAHKNDPPSFEETLHYFYTKLNRMESSFSSKLVAAINPSKPIWDSIILENLGLKAPNASRKNREAKIVEVYKKIEDWYKEYLPTEEAQKIIACFDKIYPDVKISDVKKIDYALWLTKD